MDIKKVGVVGSGIMGAGIAQTCSQAGYQVVMSDINDEAVNKGLKVIVSALKRNVEKGKMSQPDMDAILGRIKSTTNLEDFAECDLIIEAVPEILEMKRQVFAQLDGILPSHAIMASNTSVLSVTDIANATKRTEKVLGMHFSNPVPVMKILEVVITIATSDETLEVIRDFSKSIGKTVVLAKDAPGFISNRILTPFLLNAIRMLESGAGSREDIDMICTGGLGHPMGPLTLLDHIGIDTVLRGATSIYDEIKDPQYNPPTLMKKMVAVGWHGRKTGKGFYDY